MLTASRNSRILCSPRDPLGEAQRWLERFTTATAVAKEIWILGLGAGHHVRAVREAFPQMKVTVVEFDRQLVLTSTWIHADRELKVIHLETASDILKHPSFANVASHNAAILSFRPSWQGLEQEFMQLFLLLNARNVKGFRQQLMIQGFETLAKQLENVKDDDLASLKDLSEVLVFDANSPHETALWKCLRELIR